MNDVEKRAVWPMAKFWFGFDGMFCSSGRLWSAFASSRWEWNEVGLVWLGSRWSLRGITLLGLCFVLAVVDYSVDSHLVWLKNVWISPVYPREAFLSPIPSQSSLLLSFLQTSFGICIKIKFPTILVSEYSEFCQSSGTNIFGSVPFPVRLTPPDCKLRVFPRVSGYPCKGVVKPSHFRSGRRSVALLCFVLICWPVDLNGSPILDM